LCVPAPNRSRLEAATDFACLAARPKSLPKKALGDGDDRSSYKAVHPRFVIPTPTGEGILFVQLRLSSKHVVHTELFGIADSSAAFGVGMTRMIEQGNP
jgi:hypothetical protein